MLHIVAARSSSIFRKFEMYLSQLARNLFFLTMFRYNIKSVDLWHARIVFRRQTGGNGPNA